MSRNGSGVYSLPAGYAVVNGDVSDASQHTPILEDIATDLNTARPVVAGGTGAGTVAGARDNLYISGKVLSKSAGYTTVAADRAKLINCTATLTLALTAAATLGDGWFVIVKASTGNVTIDPNSSETIDGATTLVVYEGQSATITCNGSAFFSSNTVAGALTSIDINGGTIDGATIATSDITVGAAKTLDVSAGTLTLADSQITGAKVATATDTTKGVVEKATTAEAEAGTEADKFPDVVGVKAAIDANAGAFSRVLHVYDAKASGVDGGTFTSDAARTRDLNTESAADITGAGLVWSLAYDAQSANFTVGQVLTGGTSGATATIVADSDSGTTGTLKVIGITGTFADNETITDGAGGSATSNIPSGVATANQVYLPAGTYRCMARAPGHRVLSHQAWLYDVTGASILISGSPTFCSAGYDGLTESFISDKFTLATASLLEVRHRCSNTRTADGFGLAAGYAGNERYTDAMFWKL